MTLEERVARLEAIAEGIHRELSQIHSRLDNLTTLLVGTWITTIVAILAVGITLFLQIREVTQ